MGDYELSYELLLDISKWETSFCKSCGGKLETTYGHYCIVCMRENKINEILKK